MNVTCRKNLQILFGLAVWEYAKQHGLTHYDIRNHTGYLRNLLIRIATTGEIMVNLVVGYEDKKTEYTFA